MVETISKNLLLLSQPSTLLFLYCHCVQQRHRQDLVRMGPRTEAPTLRRQRRRLGEEWGRDFPASPVDYEVQVAS